jgi:N-acetylneuraminic acid mutarotase
VTNMWTQIADFPGVGRRGAVSFVVGDYAYVGTGETNSGRSADFYRFSPASGSWSPISSMTDARTSSVAFAIDSYGYVGTGNTSFGSTNDFQRYNPTTDSWEMMASVGAISRQEACGFALGGKGYLGTGDDFSSGNNFKDMYEFDPALGTWVQLGDFAGTARRYLSGTTLGGFAYVGLGTNGTNFKDFWKFDQTVSLIEQNLNDLEIIAYPNPTVESVQFVVDWNKNVPTTEMSLNITSMTGQIVYTTLLDELEAIETNEWISGSYIYSLVYDNQVVKSGQLIVR